MTGLSFSQARYVLERCRTVLGNMAAEKTGWFNEIFNRWEINAEPLRGDAKNLLPLIDAVLAEPSEATGSQKSAPPPIQQWPPVKMALWKVLMDEQLNDGHYIKAFELIEKLYSAVSGGADTLGSREAIARIARIIAPALFDNDDPLAERAMDAPEVKDFYAGQRERVLAKATEIAALQSQVPLSEDELALCINAAWNKCREVPFPLYQQEAENIAAIVLAAYHITPKQQPDGQER